MKRTMPAIPMFADHDDLPLFSGTPIATLDSPFAPAPVARPAETRDMFAELYTLRPTAPAGALVSQAPVIHMRIVRDTTTPAPAQIRGAQDVYTMLAERYAAADREIVVVLLLDTKNRVLAVDPVFIGSLNSSLITMRELFKSAIAIGAAAIIVAHNHPSGVPEPSPEDMLMTRQIVQTGKLLDIPCLDHIVLGFGRYVSIRERNAGIWH